MPGAVFYRRPRRWGFNVGDWIARSRQLYISTDGRSGAEHLYAYAQRDIARLASTLQVGQISGNSPVFGGVQLTGFQLSPDGVDGGAGGNGVVVEGQARSQFSDRGTPVGRTDLHNSRAGRAVCIEQPAVAQRHE